MEYNKLLQEFDRLVYSAQFDEACKLLEDEKTELTKNNETYKLIAVNNELIGFYRKQNIRKDCIRTIEDTLSLLRKIKDIYTDFIGTVYINIATGYTAFNYFNEAWQNFLIAEDIYNKVLDKNDQNFGALYNNIACMFLLKKDFLKAREYYKKAVDLATRNNSGLDKAMSLVGIADTYDVTDFDNEKIIDSLLMEAFELVENYPIKDDYFKFVCSKLMGNYTYYGYILQAGMLEEWIK